VEIEILNPLVKIKYNYEKDSKSAFKIKTEKVFIYKKNVHFKDIMKAVVLDINKVKKYLLENTISEISWSALTGHLASKSSDDIRQFWNNHIVPLFLPKQQEWSDEEDLALLNFVVELDL